MFESIRLWINVVGICLQLTGFATMLIATKTIRPGGGGFTSRFNGAPNVMSLVHPTRNRVGIAFVIAGSAFQLFTALPVSL